MRRDHGRRRALLGACRVLALVTIACGGEGVRNQHDVGSARTSGTGSVDTGAVLQSPATNPAPPAPSPAKAPMLSDGNIVALLTIANDAEVAAGSAAVSHAVSPDVRRFGAELARDHRALQQSLDSIARVRQIASQAPPGADTLAAHLRTQQDSVSEQRGRAFDRAFLAAQVADHARTLHDLDAFVAMTQDPHFANVLKVAARRVNAHWEQARKLQGVVGLPPGAPPSSTSGG